MRNRLFLLTGLLAIAGWVVPAAWAGQPKVSVCHYSADYGTYSPISVAEPAVPAHLEHGDQLCGTGEDCTEYGCLCVDHLICGVQQGPECGVDPSCVVIPSIEGDCFCGSDFACGTTPPCTDSSDCPEGWACQAAGSGCCGPNVCVPPCAPPGDLKAPVGPTNAGN